MPSQVTMLTSGQLLGLGTTPQQVTPSPPSGQFVIPIAFAASTVGGSSAYSGGSALALVDSAGNIVVNVAGALGIGAPPPFTNLGPFTEQDDDLPVVAGSPLFLGLGGGSPLTAGDYDVTLEVIYQFTSF